MDNNTSFERFLVLLREQLQLPLPGKKAQLLMVPEIHRNNDSYGICDEYAKKAGILILLFSRNNSIKTILIKRTEYDGVHSKQISFPGGKHESLDKSLFHTACREAHEEIGIPCSEIELLGKISELYIPPSNFLVSPYIAFTDISPTFKGDPSEVESIIEIDLNSFLNSKTIVEKEVYSANNKPIVAPCFYINGYIIWGATAMIISEFITIIKTLPDIRTILRS